MAAICPYCKANPLRIEMTAQFVEVVDPNIIPLAQENIERQRQMAKGMKGFMGGMMGMAAGMAKGMGNMMVNMMEAQLQYPPLVTILKCASCHAALSVKMGGGQSSS
ncbi:MAG: hypothetical protein ACFFCS_13430 [Candidatus Hodarchaeota archaeon]